MKVLVLGGAGYIGSHAVKKLIDEGHEVIIFDNLSTGQKSNINPKAKFYEGNITNKEELSNILKKESKKATIDIVMHFAAKIIVPESVTNPLEYYYNNVEGVRIMLEVIIENNVKNIIFSSTAATYGIPEKGICCEEDDLKPINPYGSTKLASEDMIRWTCAVNEINYGIFRYFNVAGADESLSIGYNYSRPIITHLIPIVAEVIIGKRDKLMIAGNNYNTKDGTCIRDYLHVNDLAEAHLLGAKYLLSKKESFIINLGSNEGYSVKEVADIAKKIKNIKVENAPRRPGDPAILIASNKKAFEVLGWKPKYNLEQIIATEVEYLNNKEK